jgi:hypothetical protein
MKSERSCVVLMMREKETGRAAFYKFAVPGAAEGFARDLDKIRPGVYEWSVQPLRTVDYEAFNNEKRLFR